MKEQNIENNYYYTNIRVMKIVGEGSEDNSDSDAKAILLIEGDLIDIISKKLQVFLNENLLSGGIMDMDLNKYELELIKNDKDVKNNNCKTAASYMIDFLDILREDYSINIDNNFDGLEITSEELEKLLK